jgi:hypothetical protein
MTDKTTERELIPFNLEAAKRGEPLISSEGKEAVFMAPKTPRKEKFWIVRYRPLGEAYTHSYKLLGSVDDAKVLLAAHETRGATMHEVEIEVPQ